MRYFVRRNPNRSLFLEDQECLVALGRRFTWMYYPHFDLWVVVTDKTHPDGLKRGGRTSREASWSEFRSVLGARAWLVRLEDLLGTARWTYRRMKSQEWPDPEAFQPVDVPGMPSVDQVELENTELQRHRHRRP